MRILLYGSPFDPIHDGHLHMLDTVYREKNIDKVILLITKNPRWKQTITAIDDRIAMVKRAIKGKPYIELSFFEVESEKVVHFTIDSVRHYKTIYPNDDLYYLIGGDQVDQFHKWKDADEYKDLITLVAYPRVDADLHHPNYQTYDIHPILGPYVEVSSTAIRQFQSLQTPLSVIEYILEKELYAVPKIKAFYKPKRYLHVISTAQVAYQIAKANHLEPTHAFLAAYLHDIAKDMDEEAAQDLYQNHDSSGQPVESYALHQFVGAIIAEQEFNIHHEGILEAIRFHTTGNKNMGPLAKIVYSSDKIEPLRGYDSQALIDACCRDLHSGFVEVLKDNHMYLKQKDHKISHPLVKACIQEYLGEEK
jgi:nicotinate-nucleotide adenylyltransferase